MDDLDLKIKKIDKLGSCPHCKMDWDGGEIIDVVSSLDVNTHKLPKELKIIAESFGWTEFNHNHFTKVIVHNIDQVIFFRCPEMRCGHIFNSETGEEFDSLSDAKDSIEN